MVEVVTEVDSVVEVEVATEAEVATEEEEVVVGVAEVEPSQKPRLLSSHIDTRVFS